MSEQPNSRNRLIFLLALAAICFGAGSGIGVLGYTYFVGGSGEASEPISAPTLDANARPTLSQAQVNTVLTQTANQQATIEALESGAASADEPALSQAQISVVLTQSAMLQQQVRDLQATIDALEADSAE